MQKCLAIWDELQCLHNVEFKVGATAGIYRTYKKGDKVHPQNLQDDGEAPEGDPNWKKRDA